MKLIEKVIIIILFVFMFICIMVENRVINDKSPNYEAGYNQCMNDTKELKSYCENNEIECEQVKNGTWYEQWKKNIKPSNMTGKLTFNLNMNTSSNLVIISSERKRTQIDNTCEGNQTFKINSTFIGCEK